MTRSEKAGSLSRGLELYRKKRDFRRTGEPRGTKTRPSKSTVRKFVIQKHAASHLHYDLRLALEGTLKSWAVPKGPSLNPATKRLAIQVEDHPLEYASFEGEIPSGEYGAGEVIIWDQGAWESEDKDAQAAYRTGRMHFRLAGQRLRGSWSLIRLAHDGPPWRWLLRKARDEFAQSRGEIEVVERFTTSVVSHRELPSKKPKWSESLKQARTISPKGRFQLATLADALPQGAAWIHEPKIDGYRVQATLADANVSLVTRGGKNYNRQFATIRSELIDLMVRKRIKSARFDGEIAVQDEQGRTNFQRLQNLLSAGNADEAIYFLFDLIELNGEDLRDRKLIERKKILSNLLMGLTHPHLHYLRHLPPRGDDIFTTACQLGLEGIVSKRRDSAYRGGRTRNWLKVKCHLRQEFLIVGYTASDNPSFAFGALLLGYYSEEDKLTYAGKVGTGFTQASRKKLNLELEKLKRRDPPLASTGRALRGARWVEPKIIVEIAFSEWTADGRLRHPSFQGVRTDKQARNIHRERADGSRPARPRPSSKSSVRQAKKKIAVGDGIALSHPDRPILPDSPVTKQLLADFYRTFHKEILPFMHHRPLTLVRCPQGGRACFYQKHVTRTLGGGISTVEVREKGGTRQYFTINSLHDLLALVQANVVEIHAWGCRSDAVERPDQLVFDLDPGEGVAWNAVCAAAKLLRVVLGRLGLESVLKLTGGKGLHVIVPLVRRYEWRQVKDFAHTLAASLAAQYPTSFTTVMTRGKRRGKIYLDYLRNGRGSTSILPFSPRARPGTPFAAPIGWNELQRLPRHLSLDALRDRLERSSGDPWLGVGPQSLTHALRAMDHSFARVIKR